MRVLQLNVHDPSYPRNVRIRGFLVENGCDVVVDERHDSPYYLLNLFRVVRRGISAHGPFDVVILSELSVQYALAGWIVASRHHAKYVVDSFVGMYESNVEDWQIATASSLKGRLYSLFDTLSMRLPVANLIDTDTRANQIRPRARGPVFNLPVGAPGWVRYQPPQRNAGHPLTVLYYGNYIPLHGLPFVLRELKNVDFDHVRVTFVGNGEAREATEDLARALGVHDNITWVDHVSTHQLGRIIAQHDVVLGVFGASPKAASVIANKVWQGLFAGKTVVTRRSPALSEVRDIVGRQLVEIDPAVAGSLSGALDHLVMAGDPSHQDARSGLSQYVLDRFEMFGQWLHVPGCGSHAAKSGSILRPQRRHDQQIGCVGDPR